jgi:anti-sigma factor RsiW
VTLNPIRWARFALAHRWTQRHLSEYLDGDLRSPERERAERHLSECPECHELLASLRTVVSHLRGLRGQPAQPVAASVLAGVREELETADRDDKPV